MSAKEIELSTPQIKVLNSRKPLTLNMAGQRAGKTHLMGFKSGIYVQNAPKIRGMIAANTYMQLTQSTLVGIKKVWKRSFGLTQYDKKGNPEGHYVVNHRPPDHFHIFDKFDNYNSIISFINGATVYIASLVNYMSHDGKEIGWAELDETKDTKEEALKAVILARLSQPGLYFNIKTLQIQYLEDDQDKDGFQAINPCCINTSPAVGVVKWLTDLFNLVEYEKEIHKKCTDPYDYFYKETDNQAICIYSTYWNEHNLPENYIDIRLSQISENEGLKYVFGFPFARTGDSFYRNFSKNDHVFEVNFNPELPIHLSFDFNSKPYMTLLSAQIELNDVLNEFQIRIYKEYCLSSPYNSTEAVCDRFLGEHSDYNPSIIFYGDASGDYRQAGSGDHTQFDTVRDSLSNYINTSSDRVPGKIRTF